MDLMEAIKRNNTKKFEKLVGKTSIDLNFVEDDTKMSPLHLCVFLPNREHLAEQLVSREEVNVNLRAFEDMMTPLMVAAMKGHVSVVKLLLPKPQLDVNAQNAHGQTALIYAACHGHKDVVMELLQHPLVDENIMDNQNKTALHWGIEKKHEELCYLLTYEACLGRYTSNTNRMFEEAANGNGEGLKVCLMSPRINVNQCDWKGWTPLLHAADGGHTEALEALLDHKDTDVNKTEGTGKTALMLAATKGHVDVVKMLLKYPKIDTNLVNVYGQTASYFAMENEHKEVHALLMEAAAPKERKRDRGHRQKNRKPKKSGGGHGGRY